MLAMSHQRSELPFEVIAVSYDSSRVTTYSDFVQESCWTEIGRRTESNIRQATASHQGGGRILAYPFKTHADEQGGKFHMEFALPIGFGDKSMALVLTPLRRAERSLHRISFDLRTLLP